MNRKKIIIIGVCIALVVAGAYVFSGLRNDTGTENIATPTPIAEETLYITFDGNGGYTVLDTNAPLPLPADIQDRLDSNNTKKQLFSFFPEIITLIGNFEPTTLSEVSSTATRACLYSCVEVLDEKNLLGHPKTTQNVLFFETHNPENFHIYSGVTKSWLTTLKKEAFFYHLVNNENELPVETRNTLTYTERLLEKCLKTEIIQTAYCVYDVKGVQHPVLRVAYSFDFDGNIVPAANSYLIKIDDGRYLEISNEAPDLSKLVLDIDITVGEKSVATLVAAAEITDSDTSDSANLPENTDDSTSETENSEAQYTTYAEFLDVVAPRVAKSVSSYLDACKVRAEDDVITPDVSARLGNILIGDYHVLDFAKQSAPVLNAGTDNSSAEDTEQLDRSESADDIENEFSADETDSEETEEEGFFKRLLNKLPFVSKKSKNEGAVDPVAEEDSLPENIKTADPAEETE